MRAAEALASLRIRTDTTEHSLLADAIRTEVSCTDHDTFVLTFADIGVTGEKALLAQIENACGNKIVLDPTALWSSLIRDYLIVCFLQRIVVEQSDEVIIASDSSMIYWVQAIPSTL